MLSKKIDYWSYSQFQTFLECPIAYYEIYFKGAEKMPPNIYMIYGTAIHHALAVNFKQKLGTGLDLTLENAITEFNYMFDLEVAKNKIPKEEMLGHLKICAENSLAFYLKNIAKDIQPKYVEQKFEVSLKNYPIKLLAYIDLITDDDVIIDFKTAGVSWARQYNKAKLETDTQLTFYTAIFRKVFKTKEKGVRFDIFPRGTGTVFVKEAQRSQKQVLELLKLLGTLEQIIKLGVFIPNLHSCGNCPFRNTCLKLPIIN